MQHAMDIFDRLESEVRGYCRAFPTVFTKAQGALLYDEGGNEYIDFFSGASTLNYGHNHPALQEKVIDYIRSDGVIHGLDMATSAKKRFLETFESVILQPRGYTYKLQFTGPTGTNAVEAALKLARKVKGRANVISFTNGFHGMTLGSVAATGNAHYRNGVGMPLNGTTFMPYDGYLGPDIDTLDYLQRVLDDASSGVDLPAAVIVETMQGEGGVNVASDAWLQGLERLCRERDIMLIVDDIQVGCGRSGTFFSFEAAGIRPDIVTLSKSLSGFGLPMSIVLMKPEYDQWSPGEHTGTFRGNNLAFVTAVAALQLFWQDDTLTREVRRKSKLLRSRLEAIQQQYPEAQATVRGRGLLYGLACEVPGLAETITQVAFRNGLVIETSGAESQVVKCLPPLTIDTELLEAGLDIIVQSIPEALEQAEILETESVGAMK
jgi:diaminobutyrate-2-oxoglutarate transaminase